MVTRGVLLSRYTRILIPYSVNNKAKGPTRLLRYEFVGWVSKQGCDIVGSPTLLRVRFVSQVHRARFNAPTTLFVHIAHISPQFLHGSDNLLLHLALLITAVFHQRKGLSVVKEEDLVSIVRRKRRERYPSLLPSLFVCFCLHLLYQTAVQCGGRWACDSFSSQSVVSPLLCLSFLLTFNTCSRCSRCCRYLPLFPPLST